MPRRLSFVYSTILGVAKFTRFQFANKPIRSGIVTYRRHVPDCYMAIGYADLMSRQRDCASIITSCYLILMRSRFAMGSSGMTLTLVTKSGIVTKTFHTIAAIV